MKKLLFVSCLFIAANVFSQQAKVIPPPPEAAQIQRYGDYPVAHYTGVPEIKIPLYEVKSGDLTVPIYLSYHASGIKVEDVDGIVGSGWSLNYGGSLSRSVKDKPDDRSPSFKQHYISPIGPSELEPYLNHVYDTEPDMFYFNLGKSSGKFSFKGRLQGETLQDPIFFPMCNVRYEANHFNNTWIREVFLTDEDGVRYKFGDSNATSVETNSLPSYSDFISTWKLKEIWPKNRDLIDKITFDYANGPDINAHHYMGQTSILDSVRHLGGGFVPGLVMEPHMLKVSGEYTHYITNPIGTSYEKISPVFSDFGYISKDLPYNVEQWTSLGGTTYKSKNLARINFKNGSVLFTYSSDGKKLVKLQVFDLDNSIIKHIDFHYSKYSDWTISRVKLDGISMSNAGELLKYRFDYEDELNTNYNYLAQDFWGYYNGATDNTTLVPLFNIDYYDYNLQTHHNINIGNANRNPDADYAKSCILRKIHYPTGGFTEFEYGLNQYINPETNQVSNAGGLRVEKITSSDANGGTVIKAFSYGKDNNGAGIMKLPPAFENYVSEETFYYNYIYTTHRYDFVPCTDGDIPDLCARSTIPILVRKRTLFSRPVKNIYHHDGNIVLYTHVSESVTDENNRPLGKTEYEYTLPMYEVVTPYYHNGVLNNNQGLFNTYISSDYTNTSPLLKNKKEYVLLQDSLRIITAMNYKYTPYNSTPVDAYPYFKWMHYNLGMTTNNGLDEETDFLKGAKMALGISQIYNPTNKVSEEAETSYYYGSQNQLTDSTTKTTTYGYGSPVHLFPVYIGVSTSKNSVKYKKIKYPLDYPNLSSTDLHSNGIKKMQEVHNVSEPVEEYEVVDNVVVNAKLNTYKPELPSLDASYKLSQSIPIDSFYVSKVINGMFTMEPRYDKIFQVEHYNGEGDILQIRQTDGVAVSYKWGYQNDYPIAEVKNCQHTEFMYEDFEDNGDMPATTGISPHTGKQAYSGSIDLSDYFNPAFNGKSYLLSYFKFDGARWVYHQVSYTGQTISGIIDDIRIHPVDAVMTTYTYSPLTGITSIIDGKGLTTFYNYNGFQQLREVKDHEGNILKRYDYHYRTQQ